MITISLRSVAEAFVGFAWWASFSVLALMVVLSVIAVVCGHYDDKGYWPKKALKITVLGKSRQWFRVTLLITNIACCVWLLGCHGYSPWILAVPLVSYPLSGIIITWTARLLAVFSWQWKRRKMPEKVSLPTEKNTVCREGRRCFCDVFRG